MGSTIFRKRFLSLALAVILLAALFAACDAGGGKAGGGGGAKAGGGDGGVSGKVSISIAGAVLEDGINPITGGTTRGLTSFFEANFKPKYPNIQYSISIVPWETYIAKQRTQLSAKEIDVVSAGGAEAIFWNEGLIRDIEDLLAADKDFQPETIYPAGIWKSNTHVTSEDGKHFALPMLLGRRMTVYDAKIFDDWGVEPLGEKPTPDEILEKAKRMTGINPVTGEQNYGLYFSGNSYDSPLFRALTYYYEAPGASGRLTDIKNLKWEINTDKMAKVLEWMAEATRYCNPAFINGQGNEKFGFENNDIAIYLDSGGGEPWNNYTSAKDESILKRFVPVMNLGPKGEGYVAVDSVMMAKNPQNIEAAWEVMKFMGSYEYGVWNYEDYQGTPALKDTKYMDDKDIYSKMALKIAEYAHPDMLGDDNPFYITDMVPKINAFLSNAANGQALDIPGFLQEMQDAAVSWTAAQ